MRKLIPVLLATALLLQGCSDIDPKTDTLFQKLDSTATNIGFRNMVPPRIGKFSVVDYLYYYNGAGVAAGDINNDGLTDLFFVSNEHKNKLYLNKGGLKFEDISAEAGIEGFANWKTGVTMADVNGDGFPDIYVCAVGDYLGLEGSNELYINNGDGTFTERSSAYGLDFTGFSTEAAFFDYDHDGDLDMYLLTHAKFISRSYTNVIADLLPAGEAVDFLFRNDGEKFVDVSDEAGIRKVARGYGLGVSIADLNNDGWEDIYVSNDFYESDNCFLNNHNGTFREEGKQRFGHFSHFSRGSDVADMNNDGYEDVMTVEMSSQDEVIEKTSFRSDPLDTYHSKLNLGFHYQLGRNSLQINNGGRNFSDLAVLAGVASTDYSWSTLLADYDNDGYKDIFVTTGSKARLNDLGYLKFGRTDSMRYAPQLSEHQLDRNMQLIPERKFHNYIYQGNKDLRFDDRSDQWGMNAIGLANGAIYSDLDNDGDLDLVTNNVNEAPGVYKNRLNELSKNNYLSVHLTGQGKNTFGIGAKVYVKSGDGFQLQHVSPTRGFLSSSDVAAHFGLGATDVADSVIVVWNDGKTQVLTNVAANRKITVDHREAKEQDIKLSLYQRRQSLNDITTELPIEYVHRENNYSDFYREKLIPFLVSTEGPKIAVGDVNKDGLDDLHIGGAKYQSGSLFIQQRDGDFRISPQKDLLNDSIYEDVDAVFLDVDQDNDQDLYVVTGGNEFYGNMDKQFDRLYINDGKGNFKRDNEALPPMFENKSCVRPYDFDGDGDLDLFVGGRVAAYNYGKVPRSYLLANDGKGKFADVTATVAPGLDRAGMITDASWTDTDKDGDTDLVVAGDWMPLKIFENTGNSFAEVNDIIDQQSTIKNITGWWQCLVVKDFDNDGDMDLIAGNLGTNSTLRKNGDRSIVRMYVGDLDGNNKNDQVIAYNRVDGKFYPAASMADMALQFPSIDEKFQSGSEFAGKSIEELFNVMKIDPPQPLVADQFASMYFENTGKNRFIIHALPDEVQASKIFSISAGDFNNDGHMDVLAGGNLLGTSIYQGPYDASTGIVMEGDGKGNFTIVPMNLSGEVRDIKLIDTARGQVYLVAKNNGTLQVLSINKSEVK